MCLRVMVNTANYIIVVYLVNMFQHATMFVYKYHVTLCRNHNMFQMADTMSLNTGSKLLVLINWYLISFSQFEGNVLGLMAKQNTKLIQLTIIDYGLMKII